LRIQYRIFFSNDLICYLCKVQGHIASQCTAPPTQQDNAPEINPDTNKENQEDTVQNNMDCEDKDTRKGIEKMIGQKRAATSSSASVPHDSTENDLEETTMFFDDRFLSIKVESETERLPTIELMSDHPDDKLFTMTELDDALLTSRTTSPGPDDIPLRFIQNLSSKGKERLLQIYNLIWTTHRFPQRWTQAIVLPFKKPNKTDSMPSSYRPISLTCNMCKVLEKMVNRRLLWRLESNNLLSKSTEWLPKTSLHIRQYSKLGIHNP
jgi:hypothetical protein